MSLTSISIGTISATVAAISIYWLYRDLNVSRDDGPERPRQDEPESFEELVLRIREKNAKQLKVSPEKLDRMSFDEVEERIREIEQDRESNVERTIPN